MTDPVQTTQQTSAVVDSAGGPGGVIVITFLSASARGMDSRAGLDTVQPQTFQEP